MDLAVEQRAEIAIVTLLVEELDASNAGDLKRDTGPILDSHKLVVFDLSKVRFVDSSGLGAFLSCLRRVKDQGGDLKLCGMSKLVRSVFELVRMDRVFEIYETRADAIAAFEHASLSHPLGGTFGGA